MADDIITKQAPSDDASPDLLPSNTNPYTSNHRTATISTQNALEESCGCGKQGCSCDSERGKRLPLSYVYAIGKVVHRFPNRSLEMELAQSISRRPEGETRGLTHPEVAHRVLTDPANNT
jgi:hypothetical protein